MKRNLYFLGALLAAGTFGLASCSNDPVSPEQAPVNPTFDGTSVKTQFAINVPAGVKGTRMSNQVVQDNFQFNGIQNIFLASLTAEPGATSKYTSVYRLPIIASEPATQSGIQKIYENVTIPVGTTHFVFWGESAKADGTPSKVSGVLNNNLNLNSTMSNDAVKFSLKKIDETASYKNAGKALVDAINAVIWTTNEDNLTWWALEDVADKTEGEKQLLKLKNKLCLVSVPNEKKYYRWLASYSAIENILNDLKAGLSAIADEDLSTDASHFNSKVLRDKMVETINQQLDNNIKSVDSNFPENLDLPQGAAVIEYSPTPNGGLGGNFAFVVISSQTVLQDAGAYLDASKLCYPTSLNYMVSTNLKANNNKQEAWPKSVSEWIAQQWTNWTNTVAATTQAIALVKNINYSVARLDVDVKVASVASLDDNAEILEGAALPSHIPSNRFQVTGVAVGGQPNLCDWQVLPVANDLFDQTIWDSQVNNTNFITENAANFCKTLVLDNKVNAASSTTTQKNVVIAVEIMNGSGTDFCGYNGIIKAGAKFYMIANLDLSKAKQPTGETLDHVFVQDHVTKATFTMKDLKNAYIGVPDLRSTDLQLGLSVDLEWLPGLSFDVNFQ